MVKYLPIIQGHGFDSQYKRESVEVIMKASELRVKGTVQLEMQVLRLIPPQRMSLDCLFLFVHRGSHCISLAGLEL